MAFRDRYLNITVWPNHALQPSKYQPTAVEKLEFVRSYSGAYEAISEMQLMNLLLWVWIYAGLIVPAAYSATLQDHYHEPPIPVEIRPLRIKRLDRYATKRVEPVYPPEAIAKGVKGKVVVELVYDEAGNYMYGRVLKGNRLLRDAALEAAQKWKFKPQELRGKPKKVIGQITIHFKRE